MNPALPRRAATVLLLRPAPPDGPGPEVLLVRRSKTASFMANSYVFPGGRVDEVDYQDGEALASRHAAARELREEVGITLSDTRALPLFSHWVTPSVEPKRFDTDFFLAELPPGQTPRVDAQEVFDLLWLAPREALSRYAAGELKLPPPTMANLQDLEGEIDRLGGIDGGPEKDVIPRLLAACAERRPHAVLPKLVPDAESGGIAIVLPWDPEYPSLPGEGLLLPATTANPRTSRYVLLPEGRWWAR